MKTRLQFYTALSAFFLVFNSAAQSPSPWTSRSPLKYSTSIHSLMVAGKLPGSISDEPACIQRMISHLDSGRNFYSEDVVKNHTTRLDNHISAETRDLEFFHWTKGPQAISEIAQSGSFSEIFSFLRKTGDRDPLFYVADDSESSSYAGYSLFRVRLNPDALMLINRGNPQDVWKGQYIVEEFAKSHPNLHPEECSRLVFFLILEASHVGSIAYFGINNSNGPGQAIGHQWLQLLGEWAIESMEFVRDK